MNVKGVLHREADAGGSRRGSGVTADERWLLSFYRSSEISGALFFGRIARTVRPGPLQGDMTEHFADEARHASLWTRCLEQLGTAPLKLGRAYQDRYLEAAGLPTNLMEVLSITHVFERRVSQQYARHLRLPGLRPEVAATLRDIMADERWHIAYVRQALSDLEATYGAETVRDTLARHGAADRAVYATTLADCDESLRDLLAADDDAEDAS